MPADHEHTVRSRWGGDMRAMVRRLVNRLGYDLIGHVPAERYLCEDIPGWFTANEARLLYTTVSLCRPRKLLEIGTFLGRSTASIALAIRDAGLACEFTSVDFDVADEASFRRLMPTTHGRPSVLPKEYQLVFSEGLSTSAYARRMLERHGLAQMVRLISGDFREVISDRYDLVFADCLHDADEIRRNAPGIVPLLADGGILAVHDATPANRKALIDQAPGLCFISSEDSLALYRSMSGGDHPGEERSQSR